MILPTGPLSDFHLPPSAPGKMTVEQTPSSLVSTSV